VWCAFTRNKVIGLFSFEKTYHDWWLFSGYDGEHWFASCPTGYSFLVRWYTTSLFPFIRAFQGKKFLEISWLLNSKMGPPFFRYGSTIFLLLGSVKDIVYREKVKKMWMSCITELSELQSSLPMECLPIPVEKINIVLMRVTPLIAPVLTSTNHIRNFVRCSA
jgi:hypothetical protein